MKKVIAILIILALAVIFLMDYAVFSVGGEHLFLTGKNLNFFGPIIGFLLIALVLGRKFNTQMPGQKFVYYLLVSLSLILIFFFVMQW